MPKISLCGDCVHFVCTVETIDEDYVYVVRLAQDWLEIIGSIGNDDCTITEGDCVSFSVRCDEVGIYVYG
ncbi:MAG: hypothetical protein E7559_04335 [Ruminococcaceae bacterium]|nr:hypothetical protein [Oscillospiraceae bacterium]